MGEYDTYCRICGRVQMPGGPREDEERRKSRFDAILWAVLAIVLLVFVAGVLGLLD